MKNYHGAAMVRRKSGMRLQRPLRHVNGLNVRVLLGGWAWDRNSQSLQKGGGGAGWRNRHGILGAIGLVSSCATRLKGREQAELERLK